MNKKKLYVKKIDNLELNHKEGYVVVSVNPMVYPIDVVYSACYVFMENSFVVLDGNPKKKIIVKLRPRDKKKNLEELGRDFNDELLNYAVYNTQSEKNKIIKESIVQRALFTNQGEGACEDSAGMPFEEDSYIDDPLGIAKPWEETYKGDEKEEKSDCSTETPSEEESYTDDPLGIAKPWEETHKEK